MSKIGLWKRYIAFLRRLMDSGTRVYLLLVGAVTGLGGALLALPEHPENAAEFLLLLPLEAGGEDYTPLIRHWGVLLTLVGVFMVVAAFKRNLEVPAMAISGAEKAVVAVFGWIVYRQGFVAPFGLFLDSAGAIYSLLYFLTLRVVEPLGGEGSERPPNALG